RAGWRATPRAVGGRGADRRAPRAGAGRAHGARQRPAPARPVGPGADVSDEEDEERHERRGGERGRARRRAPGLASAVAGAALLVVIGFALGVVGGLVMEEPDLLFDYVLGRTEPVAVGEGFASEPPDVAAQPPPLAEAGPVAQAPFAEAAPEPAPSP